MFATRQLLQRGDVEPLVSLAISNLQLATEDRRALTGRVADSHPWRHGQDEDDLLQVLSIFLQNDLTKRAATGHRA
eukprot:Skav229494  [mRNA]  locus=scaffold2455:32040:33212:- [translate_table: standard]